MKNKSLSKFAYIACDPGKDENPVVDAEKLQLELACSQILNITLSTPSAKNNPTSIPIKFLKYLKENYFNFAGTLGLYDANTLVSDHYLFIFALSPDATYSDLDTFKLNLRKKYGSVEFLPFTLDDAGASRLMLLSELRDFLMELYSTTELTNKIREDAVQKFSKLLNNEEQVKFIDVLTFQKWQRKDLDHLISLVNDMRKSALTNGWN